MKVGLALGFHYCGRPAEFSWSVSESRTLIGKEAMQKLQIIAEYFRFLRQQKKWWMLPMVTLLLVLGLLMLFAQSSPLAPFIYTVF